MTIEVIGFKLLFVFCILVSALWAQSAESREAIASESGSRQRPNGYDCFYLNLTVIEAYKKLRGDRIKAYLNNTEGKYFNAELETGNNHTDTYEDEAMWIYYKWYGSETNFHFTQTDGGMRMNVKWQREER
jgi:hypothetical protein